MSPKKTIYALAFATSVMAQVAEADCMRSSECDGDKLCIDRVCVNPTEPMTACEEDDDCRNSIDGVCDEGVCKPSGILCANDYGRCEFLPYKMECRCEGGSGIGMGVSVDVSGDGEMTDVPDDETLYSECVEMVESECEEVLPPDLDEMCLTDADKEICTDMAAKSAVLAANCAASWDDDDNTTTVSRPTDNPVDTNDDISMDAEMDTEGADIDAEVSPPPSPEAPTIEEADPWFIGECCEELSEAPAKYVDIIKALYTCINLLADDDCDGAQACIETYTDSAGPFVDEAGETNAAGPSDDNPQDKKGEDGASVENDENDEEADTADGDVEDDDIAEGNDDDKKDTTAATDGESNDSNSGSSGCSFAPAKSDVSILILIEMLF